MIRSFAIALTCALSVSALANAQHGSIGGRVVTSSSEPLADAHIEAIPVERSVGQERHATVTATDGRFKLDAMPAGRYRLYVWKLSAGVPDLTTVFYQQPGMTYPEAVVLKDRETKVGDLHIEGRWAWLTMNIIDARSKKPVTTARCFLKRLDVGFVIETGVKEGSISFYIPSAPVSLKLTAPGYEDWIYSEHSTNKSAVKLAPGDKVTLEIQLAPR